MENRTFSIIGFGNHCESIASKLNSEGIGLGWDRGTRLLLILVENNESDTFIIRLCKKVKEKKCRVVILSINPSLHNNLFLNIADSFLYIDKELDAYSIIKVLREVIYKRNLYCYDMNDLICFLKAFSIGNCSFQEYHFPAHDLLQIGEGKLEFEHIPTKRYLTYLGLCQPWDGKIYSDLDKVCKEKGTFQVCSIVVDEELPFSVLAIITITKSNLCTKT